MECWQHHPKLADMYYKANAIGGPVYCDDRELGKMVITTKGQG